jgi:dCTP deaminase
LLGFSLSNTQNMTLLADFQIRDLANQNKMIEPFVDHVVKEEEGNKILSYGLGSYGYDIRLDSKECFLFGGLQAGVCDPKDFDESILKPLDLHVDEKGKFFILPPYGYCLGVAKERLKLPRDVTVVAVGKSTYARSGILVNITPAEACWEGYLTLEISNCTGLFNRIYADEGITQLLFMSGEPCFVSYQDRKGKYQAQPHQVVFSKV